MRYSEVMLLFPALMMNMVSVLEKEMTLFSERQGLVEGFPGIV